MQESTERKTDLPEPKSDATSKETLADLEDNEKSSATQDESKSAVPSPDGAFDESGEAKDSGPM